MGWTCAGVGRFVAAGWTCAGVGRCAGVGWTCAVAGRCVAAGLTCAVAGRCASAERRVARVLAVGGCYEPVRVARGSGASALRAERCGIASARCAPAKEAVRRTRDWRGSFGRDTAFGGSWDVRASKKDTADRGRPPGAHRRLVVPQEGQSPRWSAVRYFTSSSPRTTIGSPGFGMAPPGRTYG